MNSHKAAEEHLRARLENKLTNHVDQSLKEMESKRVNLRRESVIQQCFGLAGSRKGINL